MIALLLGIVATFSLVIFVGAPYLPTLSPQIRAAFDLLEMEKGQTLLELGSGDGKVLLAAAQSGYKAVGIEINPLLVLVSRWRTRNYRKSVRVIWGNYWKVAWPEADGVFVFLLDRFMPELDGRMQEYRKPLVSVAFKIPDKKISSEQEGVFRYDY